MTGLALLVSIAIKATFIVTIGLAAAWMARNKRAAFRHAILAATFAMLLALPIACVVVPAFRISMPAHTEPPAIYITPAVEPTAAPVAIEESSPVPRSTSWPFSAYLELTWIAGVALSLAPVIAGLWQIRSLRRSAIPWTRGADVLLLHEDLQGPMTCGILRPVILLPREAERWSDDDLNRAMIHEQEHVRRADWLTQCMARVICSLYWFHPLVWITWRKLVLDAERSCDDAVLGRSEATAYASQLVELAKKMSASHRSPVLAMASRADLSARVSAVLDSKQARGRVGRWSLALACAAAGILVLAIAPITLVEAQQPLVIPAVIAPAPVVMIAPTTPPAVLKEVKHAFAPVGFVAAPQAPAPSQTVPSVRFMATSMLVITDVIATDKNGNAIDGLQPEDFRVTEDDAVRRISIFEVQHMAQDGGKSYYILGYYTPNTEPGHYRRIKVTAKRATEVWIEHRAGYYSRPLIVPHQPEGADPPPDSIAPPDGVVPVQIIQKVEPEYSEAARKAKWQGNVTVYVDIDESGNVTGLRLIHALGLGLDQKAIDAVKQWKFKPGQKDGKPVASQAAIDVTFRLL
jgi:TonB family protein